MIIKMEDDNIFYSLYVGNLFAGSTVPYSFPASNGSAGQVLTANSNGISTWSSSTYPIQSMTFSLSGYTLPGTSILYTNSTGKQILISQTILYQTANALIAGNLTLITPQSGSVVIAQIVSSITTGSNVTLPRYQCMNINQSGSQYNSGWLYLYNGNSLSINFNSIPTGFVGTLTIYYISMT